MRPKPGLQMKTNMYKGFRSRQPKPLSNEEEKKGPLRNVEGGIPETRGKTGKGSPHEGDRGTGVVVPRLREDAKGRRERLAELNVGNFDERNMDARQTIVEGQKVRRQPSKDLRSS